MQTTRQRRHQRIRARVHGTAARPRISVHRSNTSISVQLIDDESGTTLLSVYGRDLKAKSKVAQAQAVGQQAAKSAAAAGITTAVFDRSGYRYHGRVKAIAEGLRAGGLQI